MDLSIRNLKQKSPILQVFSVFLGSAKLDYVLVPPKSQALV